MATIRTLAQLHKLISEHGTVHVRWCRGRALDVRMGGKSRDYVSGGAHAGLSAVALTSDDYAVASSLARCIGEYGFVRLNDPARRCYIITGAEVLGRDSDGCDSIAPGEYHAVSASLLEECAALRSAYNKATGCTYGGWTADQRREVERIEGDFNARHPLAGV